MVKVVVFFIIVSGIMFYPLFINNTKHISKHRVKNQVLSVPDINIEEGKFFIYKKTVEKKGDFKTLNVYKKKYVAFDLKVKDILKNEQYKSSKAIFKENIIEGYKVWYKNKDIELITNQAVYNKKTDVLKGGKFELYSKNFKGYGNEFTVDNKKNISANDITYYLKVEK